MAKRITPQKQDYSQWYNDIIREAGMAEHSAVKGCMIIKPYGYSIWESIQQTLDRRFKETGHQNAYFPLFVPKSFLSKEAAHVEGFAKECAVVTHYRLKNDPETGEIVVDPDAKLEEELIVRPTSETVIWNAYRSWIQSYRDLPLLYNQWANVVRWEMRTRLFLRTTEFLWQEGHTAHATAKEAEEETMQMLEVYRDFAENVMALPVLKGTKSETERFAGAVETYCIEALMQDGRALQAGTSHFLGQNFAKAFDVQFTNSEGGREYVWATSWGVSTRLIGALIMAHSDDNGLVLPPRLAPIQVVIVPIYKSEEERNRIREVANTICQGLRAKNITVYFDDRDTKKPGWKFTEHEVKGVPVRLTLGPKDLDKESAEVFRRDTLEKFSVQIQNIENKISNLLENIQHNLYQKAQSFLEDNTRYANTWEEFTDIINNKGGFVLAHWDGNSETELKIKEETKATIRSIPMDGKKEEGKCIYSGKPSGRRVVFAKAY